MQVFSLCLTLITAASFTSSQENSKKFSNYQGNLGHLEELVKIFGTASDGFNRQAVTLDEVLGDSMLILSLSPLKGLDANLHKLGVLLGDLSPARFDQICTALDANGSDVTEMVRGYPSQLSEWKKAANQLPQVESISYALLQRMSPDLCEYFAMHPEEILTEKCASYCITQWIQSGNIEGMERILRQQPWFQMFHATASLALRNQESKYIQMLCDSIKQQSIIHFHQISLPSFINAQHVHPLVELARSQSWPYGLQINSVGQDQELKDLLNSVNLEVRERNPVFENIMFDSESFMGKWALPKCIVEWTSFLQFELQLSHVAG